MKKLKGVLLALLLSRLGWAAMGGDSNTSRLDQAVLDPETWALSPLVEGTPHPSPSPTRGEGTFEPFLVVVTPASASARRARLSNPCPAPASASRGRRV
jgi:hypothetical protein